MTGNGLKEHGESAESRRYLAMLTAHGQAQLARVKADPSLAQACLLDPQAIGMAGNGLKEHGESSEKKALLAIMRLHAEAWLTQWSYDPGLPFAENTTFQQYIAEAGPEKLGEIMQIVRHCLPLDETPRQDLPAIVRAVGDRLAAAPELLDGASITALFDMANAARRLWDEDGFSANSVA